MMTKPRAITVETPEAFCRRLSGQLCSDGFDVEIRPGDHLIDDAGADSLLVMQYVLLLEEMGIDIDLSAFDTGLLDTDVAYQTWLRKTVAGTA